MNNTYLNIGKQKINGFINIDINDEVGFQSDVIQKLPFPENSVKGIFCDYLLEKLMPAEVEIFFNECKRILEPQGSIKIVTLDLDKIIKKYECENWKDKENTGLRLDWITNRCEMFNLAFREDNRKWIYNRFDLLNIAEMTGFSSVGPCFSKKNGDTRLKNLPADTNSKLVLEFFNNHSSEPSPGNNDKKILLQSNRNYTKYINSNGLLQDKLDLIDYAFSQFNLNSFADLGGVWGVNGGYTYYTMSKHDIKNAFLVDTNFNSRVLNEKKYFPGLKTITGNFGDTKIAQQIEYVDAIFLFDVLLHQVKPDWDKILEIYQQKTNCFIVYNQQYTDSKHTVRLLDLGKDKYFETTPHSIEEGQYRDLFEKMYEIHPQHNRIYRDIHNVWQWGIVDVDLIAKMNNLGYSLEYFRDCGSFGDLKKFKNKAFIFYK